MTIEIAAAPSEEAKSKHDSSGKRLNPAQRAEMVALWELGQTTQGELSEKFGISKTAVQRYLKRNRHYKFSRASEVSDAVTTAVKAAAVEIAETFESKRAMRVEKEKEEIYKRAKYFSQANMKFIIEALKGSGASIESLKDTFKSLQLAIKNDIMTGTTLMNILGAKDLINAEDLPEIRIIDLTKEDIENFQKRDQDDLSMEDLEDLDEKDDEGLVVEDDE